jgi:hypothetical protein
MTKAHKYALMLGRWNKSSAEMAEYRAEWVWDDAAREAHPIEGWDIDWYEFDDGSVLNLQTARSFKDKNRVPAEWQRREGVEVFHQ